MKCKVCNTENMDTAKFCKHCGNPIDIQEQPQQDLTEKAEKSTIKEENNENSVNKRKKIIVLSIVLVILLFFVIGIGLIYWNTLNPDTVERMLIHGKYSKAKEYCLKREPTTTSDTTPLDGVALSILSDYKDKAISYERTYNSINTLLQIDEARDNKEGVEAITKILEELQLLESSDMKASSDGVSSTSNIDPVSVPEQVSEEEIFYLYDVEDSIRQAELGSGLVQVNECILKEDESMTLGELIDCLKNSKEGIYLSFKYMDNDINMDGVNEPGGGIACTCFHDYYGRKFFTVYALNLTDEKVRNKDLSVIEVAPEYEARELLFNIHYAGNINAGLMKDMGLETSEYYDKADGLNLTYDTINGYINKQTEFVEQTSDSTYNVYTIPHILKSGDDGETIRFVYMFDTDLQTLKCRISRRRAEEKNYIKIGEVNDKSVLDSISDEQWDSINNSVIDTMEHSSYPYSEEGSVVIKGIVLYKQYTNTQIAFICKGTSPTQGDHYDLCKSDIYIGFDGNVHIGNVGQYDHFWPSECGGEEQAEIKAIEKITRIDHNEVLYSYR